MPRYKSKKRTNKRQAASNVIASVQKLEMDLLQAPSKLADQLDKEINATKKQENKLIKALNKVQKQVTKAEARIKSAEKAKSSHAGKKQFKIGKKMYKEAAAAYSEINKQLQAVTNTLAALLDKQSKFIALGKQLNQFNKEWIKSAKQAKAKAKSKPQAKKTRAKSKSKNKAESRVVEQFHTQPVETTMEDSSLDEITELAS